VTQIYITGASGVLGAECVSYFLQDPRATVHAVSRRPCPLLPATHAAQRVVASVFEGGWYDPAHADATIVHCAGLSDPRKEYASFATLAQDDILPHVAMVEALLERGWRGKLIYMSSGGAIYGNPQVLPIPETHPTSPISLYGLHKLCIERALEHLARSRGFELVILRVSNPYGGRLAKRNQGVIPILVRAYATGSLFQIIGDGTAQRDYIDMRDFCHAVGLCIGLKMTDPVLTLNIGSGTGITLNDLIRQIGQRLGQTLRTQHVRAVHDVQSNVLCCDRARDVLGWQARISLQDGLDRYLTTVLSTAE
jgi:UDP-glucose 4-epimerase